MALFDFATGFLTNTFIFQVFIPFIILFAIVWGLLEAIGKLGHKVNLVVAIGFALLAAYTNPFILAYIATLGSTVAVVLFGILFLFGIIRWGLSRGHDIYLETSSYEKQYQKLVDQKAKLYDKLRTETDKSKQQDLAKQISDIERKMKILEVKKAV